MKSSTIKQYDFIDALRGFAILGVIWVHAAQWIEPSSGLLKNIASQGARGVQLFFVASALTLFLSMSARKQRESRPLLSFAIRRFFRIAPLFYVGIVVYTIFGGYHVEFWAPNGIEWWYIALTGLFIHGWHPETINSVVPGGWSIAVEMTFYVFVPFLFLTLNTLRKTLYALFASVVAASAVNIALPRLMVKWYPADQYPLLVQFAELNFFSQIPVFLVGIALFYFVKKNADQQDRALGSLFLVASLYCMLATVHMQTWGNLLPQHIVYAVIFGFFSYALSLYPNILFVNLITRTIGKLSFSLYLTHFIVIALLKSYLPEESLPQGNVGWMLATLMILAGAMLFSTVTYHFIEKPGVQLGKKLITRLR